MIPIHPSALAPEDLARLAGYKQPTPPAADDRR